MVTRAFARGAAIGALVLSWFGAFWAFASIVHWPAAPPWAYAAAGLPVVALTLFSASRIVGSATLPPANDEAEAAREGKRMGRNFGIVCGIEFALIGAAAAALGSTGHPLLIPVAIALIVGLHFLPLARVFGLRVYTFTGVLCVACSLASLLVTDETARLLALGLAMAAVLWVSAGLVLFRYTGRAKEDPGKKTGGDPWRRA